jgi:hypothetical protein
VIVVREKALKQSSFVFLCPGKRDEAHSNVSICESGRRMTKTPGRRMSEDPVTQSNTKSVKAELPKEGEGGGKVREWSGSGDTR